MGDDHPKRGGTVHPEPPRFAPGGLQASIHHLALKSLVQSATDGNVQDDGRSLAAPFRVDGQPTSARQPAARGIPYIV